jgi:hypothetical protein
MHTRHASEPSPQAAIVWSVTIVIVAVGTLTWATTAGDRLLPPLLLHGTISPWGKTVNGLIALTNILTLLLLWTRGRSVLDLWIMVALCAMIGDAVMITFFIYGSLHLWFLCESSYLAGRLQPPCASFMRRRNVPAFSLSKT